MTKSKKMPANLEAESFLIAALLTDQRAFDRISQKQLSPGDFYDKRHENIFRAFIELNRKNHPVDIITLTDELQKNNLLETSGGATYISSLVDKFPTTANIVYYADIIKSKSLLRQLILTSNIIIEKSMNEEYEAKDLIEEAEKNIFSINNNNNPNQLKNIKVVLKDTMGEVMKMINGTGELSGIPTGYPDLDELTNGFQNEQLVVIAARPSVGKTAFALNIVANAALKHGKKIGFFSCEMSARSLLLRMLCTEAEVNQQLLRRSITSNKDKDALLKAAERLYEVQLTIDDTASISLLDLISKARRMKREMDIDILIIDYLQLVTLNEATDMFKPRHEQVAFISKSLKELSRQLHIPVVALAQLNRNIDVRGDESRPKLSDLKDSGSIEQDADLILFIYKPKDKDKDENGEKPATFSPVEKRTIIVGKNRNGPTGEAKFVFFKTYTKFVTQIRDKY